MKSSFLVSICKILFKYKPIDKVAETHVQLNEQSNDQNQPFLRTTCLLFLQGLVLALRHGWTWIEIL
jgi:hypothetical protein